VTKCKDFDRRGPLWLLPWTAWLAWTAHWCPATLLTGIDGCKLAQTGTNWCRRVQTGAAPVALSVYLALYLSCSLSCARSLSLSLWPGASFQSSPPLPSSVHQQYPPGAPSLLCTGSTHQRGQLHSFLIWNPPSQFQSQRCNLQQLHGDLPLASVLAAHIVYLPLYAHIYIHHHHTINTYPHWGEIGIKQIPWYPFRSMLL